VTATRNGHAVAQDALAGLAARLTDPGDRERYAAVLSYVQRLPPTDEFRQLVDLMGSLTLLSQHIPDAIAEFLEAFRQESKASGEYYARVDERLASLPQEIAAGVDPGAIAKAMSESFRQQIAASGLRDSIALLDASAKETKAAAGEIWAMLKPVTQDSKKVAAAISAELTKLIAASRQVQEHNARLVEQERQASWLWIGTAAMVVFLAEGACGLLFEKWQTADFLAHLDAQIQRVQTPAVPAPAPVKPGTTKPQSQRRKIQ
jgi:hypothetical protein